MCRLEPTYCVQKLATLVMIIGLSMLGPDGPDYHKLLRALLLPQQCSGMCRLDRPTTPRYTSRDDHRALDVRS
jgi:hypothetical protein